MNTDKLIALAKQCVIRTKGGKLATFGSVISQEQVSLLTDMHTHDLLCVPKSRQIGISTVSRIYQILYALSNKDATCVLLSNKYSGTQELSRMDTLILTSLGKLFKKELVVRTNSHETELINGSRILRFSGSAKNDRGYTIDHLHISEFAYVDRGEDLLAAISSSLSPERGRIIIESTPSHYGDPLHKIATAESTRWHTVFLPWFSFNGYRRDATNLGNLFPEEAKLIGMGLDLEQVAWRRNKLDELAGDLFRFKREFPISLEEAYSMAEGAYLQDETASKLPVSNTYTEGSRSNGIRTWTSKPYDPRKKGQYCIGYDPSGGTGGDYACAVVLDRTSRAIVHVSSSNTSSVNAFTKHVVELAETYGRAKVLYELNNHGHGCREVFAQVSCDAVPFQTNAKTKVALLDLLRTRIHDQLLGIIDPKTAEEIRSLVRSPKGLAPSAPIGSHDDRVMAYALALHLDSTLIAVPTADERLNLLYSSHNSVRTGRPVPRPGAR